MGPMALIPPRDEVVKFTPDFRMSDDALIALAEKIIERKPLGILETGPGISSWVFYRYYELAEWLVDYKILNHAGEYDVKFRNWASGHGFPLHNLSTVLLKMNGYYDLTGVEFRYYDFICLDGPVSSTARSCDCVKRLLKKVSHPERETTIVIDDSNRPSETMLLNWLLESGFVTELEVTDKRFVHRRTTVIKGRFKS